MNPFASLYVSIKKCLFGLRWRYPILPWVLQYHTMILQRPRIIVRDTGFEPGTSAAPTAPTTPIEPSHLQMSHHISIKIILLYYFFDPTCRRPWAAGTGVLGCSGRWAPPFPPPPRHSWAKEDNQERATPLITRTWYPFLPLSHRRRIYTEEKAKVVATVWGTEHIQFLASYFAPGWFENRMISSFFVISSWYN